MRSFLVLAACAAMTSAVNGLNILMTVRRSWSSISNRC